MAESKVKPSRTIHLAHGSDASRSILEVILKTLGHDVRLSTPDADTFIEKSLVDPPDILIGASRLNDADGLEALIRIGDKHPRPAILLAEHGSQEKVERAMEDHVMAYLVEPVSASQLEPAIYLAEQRFQKFRRLELTVEGLRDELETRKVLAQAKGILMEQRKISEREAHQLLQKTARSKRLPIRRIAQVLIDAESFLDDDTRPSSSSTE